MRAIFCVIGILSGLGVAFGQQQSLNGHYYFNPFTISNAWAGTEEGVEAFASMRQNRDQNKYAPGSYIGTVHCPFGEYKPKSYPMPVLGITLNDTLQALLSEKEPTDPKFNQGLGVDVRLNNQGTVDVKSLVFSYALFTRKNAYFNVRNDVSAGLGIGLANLTKHFTDVSFTDTGTTFSNSNLEIIKPKVELGINLYLNTIRPLRNSVFSYALKQDVNYSAEPGLRSGKSSMRWNHFFMAERVIRLKEDMYLMPNFLYIMVGDVPNQLECNVQYIYKRFNAGLGYRWNGDLILNAGLMFTKTWAFNYSYDVLTSNNKPSFAGNHQLSVGFSKRKKIK